MRRGNTTYQPRRMHTKAFQAVSLKQNRRLPEHAMCEVLPPGRKHNWNPVGGPQPQCEQGSVLVVRVLWMQPRHTCW